MKKYKSKIFRILLIFCLMLTIIPSVAYANDTDDVISKTKTATNLDDDFDSKVTLTFAGKEKQQNIIDIVFVIDCTSVAEYHHKKMYDQLIKIKTELQNFEGENKPQINVAFVGFGNDAKTFQKLTSLENLNIDASFNSIKSWAASNGGTNIQKGILAGKSILDQSTTGTSPDSRYLVLLTDGGGFWYNRDGTDTGDSVQSVFKTGSNSLMAMSNMDSNSDLGWASHKSDSMFLRELKNFTSPKDAFAHFISEQGDAIEASAKNKSSKYDIVFAQWGLRKVASYTQNDVGAKDENGNWTIYPYTDMERGTYFAAKALERVKAEGYQIKSIGYEYTAGLASESLTATTTAFREWTSTVGDYYDGSNENVEIFDDIKTKMFDQYIDHGSVVIDEMGYGQYDDGKPYDLDFVNDIETLTLRVGDVELNKEKINDYTYGFGKDSEDGYQFILTYYQDGLTYGNKEYKECFKIDINVPVTSNKPVSLIYHVTLPEEYRQSKIGTYGIYDEDGSEKYNNLKTNHVAEIYPEDSKGEKGNIEKFPEPTVSYEVDKTVGKYDISGTKTWNDNNNQDNYRPDSLTIQLQRSLDDGNTWQDVEGQSQVIDDDNLSYQFENVPAMDEGKDVIYRVVETKPKGGNLDKYIQTGGTEKDNYNLINTYTPINLIVKKVDSKDQTTVLSGAEFKLYQWSKDEKKYVEVKQCATDENGQIEISKLNYNTAYYLEETKAPQGYELPKGEEAKQYFYIHHDNTNVYPNVKPKGFKGEKLEAEVVNNTMNVSLTLKNKAVGHLEIVKTLNTYNESLGEAMFAFQVDATANGELIYSQVLSMNFNEAGTKTLRVENLPTGAEVTVTEIYSGATYKAETSQVKTIIMSSKNGDTTVNFTNNYTEEMTYGSGIHNHIEKTNGQWSFVQQKGNQNIFSYLSKSIENILEANQEGE